MTDTKEHKGGRAKLPDKEILSRTVYVLLRPDERAELDRLARDPNGPKSRSAIMRTAFRFWLSHQKQ